MSFNVSADAYLRFMGRYSEPLAAQFADLARVRGGQRLLDVGCGPGALTAELVSRAETAAVSAVEPSGSFGALETLLELDQQAFRARFRGSALTRTKRAGLLRNAAIVLANRGEGRAAGALSRALDDEDAVVRRAAARALEKLGAGRGAAP